MSVTHRSPDPFAQITEALEAVRDHLNMDASYLSEIGETEIIVRAITTAEGFPSLPSEIRIPIEAGYCAHVADGRLPAVLTDTLNDTLAAELPVTQEFGIRSNVSVPIHRSDGSLYGMFCCFSTQPNPSLNERDRRTMEIFADLAARPLNACLDAEEAKDAMRDQVATVIRENLLDIYFQPIVSLNRGAAMAVEALSRFRVEADKGVQWWFSEANKADMAIALETAAAERALQKMPHLPEGIYMSINLSPATLASDGFFELLQHVPVDRLFLEITEHTEITMTPALMERILALQARRIGIAIDDVGAGYAGLNAIIAIKPNVIKLDRALVQDIHSDPAKQALTRAMLNFAEGVDAFLIAEGVETADEDRMLKSLGMRLAQGFHYGRPEPADAQITRLRGLANLTPQVAPSLAKRALRSRAKSSPA